MENPLIEFLVLLVASLFEEVSSPSYLFFFMILANLKATPFDIKHVRDLNYTRQQFSLFVQELPD